MARAQQESMALDEHKPRVSITQVRKIMEYAARADWHFRRGNDLMARQMIGRAGQVLVGCQEPEGYPMNEIYQYVTKSPPLRLDDLQTLREQSLLALQQYEDETMKVARGR